MRCGVSTGGCQMEPHSVRATDALGATPAKAPLGEVAVAPLQGATQVKQAHKARQHTPARQPLPDCDKGIDPRHDPPIRLLGMQTSHGAGQIEPRSSQRIAVIGNVDPADAPSSVDLTVMLNFSATEGTAAIVEGGEVRHVTRLVAQLQTGQVAPVAADINPPDLHINLQKARES